MEHGTYLLTWDDFDEMIDRVSHAFNPTAFDGIYGVPRGGLPIAVALSHVLELPLLSDHDLEHSAVLWVDDICDKGNTVLAWRDKLSQLSFQFVWIYKRGAIPQKMPTLCIGQILDGNPWVVFPWECAEHAARDRQQYEASRQ